MSDSEEGHSPVGNAKSELSNVHIDRDAGKEGAFLANLTECGRGRNAEATAQLVLPRSQMADLNFIFPVEIRLLRDVKSTAVK